MAMIKFEQVTKKFGEAVVVDGVSFQVEPGELIFLTGPSGAGKTTLVRLILKELEPSSGKIFLQGNDLSLVKKRQIFTLRRKMGVVFQDFKLLSDRTVRENVSLALEVTGTRENDHQLEEVLNLVSLSDKADLFPSQLAGGELQRTCLARALVTGPEIIIADEPTGNLDIATAWQIVSLLREINKMGKTVLIATHNYEIVNSLKTRVLELNQGKLIRDEIGGQYKIR